MRRTSPVLQPERVRHLVNELVSLFSELVYLYSALQYAARLDQKEEEWEDYEERLRNSIIAILPCDLMCSDPLVPKS